ncbi:hypothetical protein BSKO_06761 [Bryopsis sp. KO-2023]|nr:hypothetical protein BSKO_06761 [Bryopsis sp. KO-2023]
MLLCSSPSAAPSFSPSSSDSELSSSSSSSPSSSSSSPSASSPSPSASSPPETKSSPGGISMVGGARFGLALVEMGGSHGGDASVAVPAKKQVIRKWKGTSVFQPQY